MRFLKILLVDVFVLGLFFSVTSQAASFDCTKASSKIEKIICTDKYLSKMDEDLAAAYKRGQQNDKQADFLRREQMVWLKGRNNCTDAACVRCFYSASVGNGQ